MTTDSYSNSYFIHTVASPWEIWENTKEQEQVFDMNRRFYGARSNTTLMSQQAANQFVRWLLPAERTSLYEALREFELEEGALDSKIGGVSCT